MSEFATSSPDTPEPRPKASILVIDDDDTVSAAILRILRGDGYQVVRASNGREGVDMYRAAPPQLILTDLVMPDMEGLETIQVLRRLDPDIPIIAMSGGGRGDPETYLDMAGKLGATQTLSKPFTRDRLLATIEKSLSG